MKHAFSVSFLCLALLFTGCATQRAKLATWWSGSGKADLTATADLIASEAQQIAVNTVYSQATNAEDALAKNFNVQGFGDALRALEGGAVTAGTAQIPDFVMKLRNIWLGPQNHYTDLAASVGSLIETKFKQLHPTSNAQVTNIIEGVIAGLQTPPPPPPGTP